MALLVISIVTPGLSKPKPVFVPIIAAGSAAIAATGIGISASGCHTNCWLNDWKARDRECGNGGKYSYDGPVHGKCFCCRK